MIATTSGHEQHPEYQTNPEEREWNSHSEMPSPHKPNWRVLLATGAGQAGNASIASSIVANLEDVKEIPDKWPQNQNEE
jgi:hypothetical protein